MGLRSVGLGSVGDVLSLVCVGPKLTPKLAQVNDCISYCLGLKGLEAWRSLET